VAGKLFDFSEEEKGGRERKIFERRRRRRRTTTTLFDLITSFFMDCHPRTGCSLQRVNLQKQVRSNWFYPNLRRFGENRCMALRRKT
jgi:hypothetical protein